MAACMNWPTKANKASKALKSFDSKQPVHHSRAATARPARAPKTSTSPMWSVWPKWANAWPPCTSARTAPAAAAAPVTAFLGLEVAVKGASFGDRRRRCRISHEVEGGRGRRPDHVRGGRRGAQVVAAADRVVEGDGDGGRLHAVDRRRSRLHGGVELCGLVGLDEVLLQVHGAEVDRAAGALHVEGVAGGAETEQGAVLQPDDDGLGRTTPAGGDGGQVDLLVVGKGDGVA